MRWCAKCEINKPFLISHIIRILCYFVYYTATVPSQWAHNVKMTSYQRRCDVITSHRRWYDIILMLCVCWVVNISLDKRSIKINIHVLCFPHIHIHARTRAHTRTSAPFTHAHASASARMHTRTRERMHVRRPVKFQFFTLSVWPYYWNFGRRFVYLNPNIFFYYFVWDWGEISRIRNGKLSIT